MITTTTITLRGLDNKLHCMKLGNDVALGGPNTVLYRSDSRECLLLVDGTTMLCMHPDRIDRIVPTDFICCKEIIEPEVRESAKIMHELSKRIEEMKVTLSSSTRIAISVECEVLLKALNNHLTV